MSMLRQSLLFVDDEPKVLQGLKRMLFKMKNRWNIFFAESGKEALTILEKENIQVVITDMLMPEMNGIELMKIICNKYPKTLRVVLSGQSEPFLLIEASKLAHQFLSKPCDATRIIETIEQMLLFKQSLHQEETKRIVSCLSLFSSMPRTFQKISEEIKETEYSASAMAKIISEDNKTTEDILELTNSSFFSFLNKIKNIEEATEHLSPEVLRSFIVSKYVFGKNAKPSINFFDLNLLLNHSLMVARLSKAVATYLGLNNLQKEQAFISGLLHDIGKVVLISNFSQTYNLVINEARKQNRAIWEIEKEIIGTTHAEIGAYFLSLLNFDEEVIDSVYLHHSPNLCIKDESSVLASVYIGNIMEHNLVKLSPRYAPREFDKIYIERMNLTDKLCEINNICTSACEEVYGGE